jgi:hypothetical protein
MRTRTTIAFAMLAVVLALFVAPRSARADHFAQLERATHDPSWRVRLQAAYVLFKQKDQRVMPILERLLADENQAVRTFAEKALSSMRTRAAPPSTPAPAASRGTVHIAIGGVGAKPKNVSPDMTKRLRELLVREFANTPGLTLDGQPVSGFLIDSSITALNQRATRDWIEVNCEISVVVGRLPSKAMVMMTSGGATVQEAKGGWRQEHAATLQADALEGAVKGAHENLLAYLRQQH